MIIEKQKILPISSVNYERKETPIQIIELLKKQRTIPITIDDIQDGSYDKVVGCISSKNNFFYEEDGFIKGNITIYDKYIDYVKDWINDEVQVNDNMEFIKLIVVQYGTIKGEV